MGAEIHALRLFIALDRLVPKMEQIGTIDHSFPFME
jgi:hypothetical protein